MSQSEPETDLISWLEQQWDKAVKDSETPDGELLEKYTFYDGLTTAYEFTIARVKQYGVQPTTDSRTAALMEIIDYANKKKKRTPLQPYDTEPHLPRRVTVTRRTRRPQFLRRHNSHLRKTLGRRRIMLNLKELIDVGCVQTMVDSDGQIYPCSKPIVAIRHWPDYGEGDSYSGVCQQHSQQAGIEFIPLKNVPNPLLLPFYLTYEDIDDSSSSTQPQVGDYGVAVRENAHGQEEIPFHIEQEEHTGLPVAVLNTQLYAKPEDDIEDGQYVSLFQLYLDGFELSRTGRK